MFRRFLRAAAISCGLFVAGCFNICPFYPALRDGKHYLQPNGDIHWAPPFNRPRKRRKPKAAGEAEGEPNGDAAPAPESRSR